MSLPTFSRLVITGDLLRPYPVEDGWESATWKNIRWLSALLRPLLPEAAPAPTALAWDALMPSGAGAFFDTPAVYDALGETIGLDSWARLAQRPTAPDALVEALREPLRDALVIGYELPPVLLDALRQLQRPVIDLILHPLRFLPDLVFAMRTNVPAFHEVLTGHALAPREVSRQVGLIQAKAAWLAPPAPMPPGTALVLGQVASDRAMVQADGGFAQLDDHLAELHRLCREHPLVLYKPHPYAVPGAAGQRFLQQLPCIATTSANLYHLLAQPELDTVLALNSSGLVEARAFGQRAVNLVPFLYDFDSPEAPGAGHMGGPVTLSPAWTEPGFWQAMLTGEAWAPPATAWTPNRLRRSMNADWGYQFVEQVCA